MARERSPVAEVGLLILTILSVFTIILFPIMLVIDYLYWRSTRDREPRPAMGWQDSQPAMVRADDSTTSLAPPQTQDYGHWQQDNELYPGGSTRSQETSGREYWQGHNTLYAGGSGNSREWQQLRLQVIQRDNYRCVRCGRLGRYPKNGRGGPSVGLRAHHILPLSKGGTNDPSNLVTLCVDCHDAEHGSHMKGAW